MSRLVLLVLSIPCMIFLMLTEELLRGIGQDEALAASAGVFCVRLVPRACSSHVNVRASTCT